MGVVLDVDDTLYLERDYVHSGFDAVGTWCSQTLGLDEVGQTAWAMFLAGRRNTTLTDALESLGVKVTDNLRRAVIDVYRSHDPNISLLEDAETFLQAIPANLRVGVLTDGPEKSQEAKCRALGLGGVANPVVISSRLGTSKPDERLFRVFEREWGLAGEGLVYIADNPHKDFAALSSLGWSGIRIRRPGSLHEAVDTPTGVIEVEQLDGLSLWAASDSAPGPGVPKATAMGPRDGGRQ